MLKLDLGAQMRLTRLNQKTRFVGSEMVSSCQKNMKGGTVFWNSNCWKSFKITTMVIKIEKRRFLIFHIPCFEDNFLFEKTLKEI